MESGCESPTLVLSSEGGSPSAKDADADSVIVISSGADGSPCKAGEFTPTKR